MVTDTRICFIVCQHAGMWNESVVAFVGRTWAALMYDKGCIAMAERL